MAQQEFYTILTSAGLAYEANRKALGLPIKLVEMSVGDGNGAVYNPSAAQTTLAREVWRGPINALLQDATNPSYLVGELSLPDDVGGWYVREVGFWTDSGILYAIGKYPESFKPQLATGAGKEFYIRAIFETSNAESVTLVVDDTVVKATRAFVIDYVAAELAKQDGKRSVRAATTGPIVLSGAQLIDTVAVIAGDRVLVKDQADRKANGIYVVANGAWSRAVDADSSVEVTPGLFVPVEEGAANSDSVWQLVTNAPILLGTTDLLFEPTLGRSGVVAGAYDSLTVDKYGRVVGGTRRAVPGLVVFSAPGVSTFTVPADATASTEFEVEVWGAGAGGAGGANGGYSGGGGGGGGYAFKRLVGLVAGSTVTVTVGAGGVAGAWGYPGATGGSSTFGAHCSASGGQAGQVINAASPGAEGGAASGGDINIGGSPGDPSEYTVGGNGGSGAKGGGGGVGGYSNVGTAGRAPGGGGGGGDGPSYAGGPGANGLVVVRWR